MCARDSSLRRGVRIFTPRDLGFGQLYDEIGDAVIVADATTGNVVLTNPAAKALFGYEDDELIGKPVEVLMPARYREAHRRGMATYAQTEEGRMIDSGRPLELIGLRKDGSEFEIEMSLARVRASRFAGRFVVAMIRDCAERKAAERQLAASEARWRALVDQAPDLILTTDTAGKVLTANRAVQALGLGSLVGRSIFEVALPLVNTRLRPAFEEVARNRRAVAFTGRGQARLGHAPWYHVRVGPLHVDGWLDGFMVIATDVSAERAADEAMRDLAHRLADAQRISHVGSWEWEVARDALTWSDELFAIYGVDPAGFHGHVQDFVRALHPADRVRVQALIQDVLAAPRSFAFEHRLVRPNGGERTVHCQGDVLLDARNRPSKLVGTCQDVTELRESARRVAERDAELRRERDLARERTEFMHAVAHDLQNPLTAIVGYTEFLEDGPLAAEQRGYVAEVAAAAQRMKALIADLLDVARLAAGSTKPRLGPADLATLVREAVAAMQPSGKAARVAVLADLPPGPLPLRTDGRRVAQVLGNLLTNAVKFSPEGGAVRVRARSMPAGFRVEVEDTGLGIAAEDRGKLFQRFSQLPAGRKRGGTGLGLGISRTIVEALGGEIGVESQVGRGSTFWFTLPGGD